MKQTIKRSRVLEIVHGYESLKSLSGIKLAYAISKNMAGLRREKESIVGAFPENVLTKYNEEYVVILDQEAKKDESGNAITDGTNTAIANLANFNAKLKVLKNKYAKELAEQENNDKKIKEFLNEDFEFDFFQFEESNLPESITVEQMGLLGEMIKQP